MSTRTLLSLDAGEMDDADDATPMPILIDSWNDAGRVRPGVVGGVMSVPRPP